MDLKDGRVVIQLLPDLAPKAVARVKDADAQGLLRRHAVPPRDRGLHGPGRRPDRHRHRRQRHGPPCRPNSPRTRQFLRGTVGAARTTDPNSADSQFFIMFAPAPNLDGQYTIWGQVVSGMEFVDKIKRGSGATGS